MNAVFRRYLHHFSLHFKGSFLLGHSHAKMSLSYCFIHFISFSGAKSCCRSSMPLNKRMQSTYPWQYAFCPSIEFISSNFAIHSKSIFCCSCESCCSTASNLSRSPSSSSCVFLYPDTSTMVSLVTFSQRSRFKNCPTCSHISFCIVCPPSENLIIIINISSDITPYKFNPMMKKEYAVFQALYFKILPIPFDRVHPIVNLSHCLNICWLIWVILYFLPKTVYGEVMLLSFQRYSPFQTKL